MLMLKIIYCILKRKVFRVIRLENKVIIKAENLYKIYQRGSEKITALNNISLEIRHGDYIAFVGNSGSGKTTLINILGCLDNPTSGKLVVNDKKIFDNGNALTESALTIIRRELYGYIFQKFYLIPTLNVLENVSIPLIFYKKEHTDDDNNIKEILCLLGIDNRAYHLPSQLSGGEMQRVAIARALVNKPCVLLADEPTGNLDTKRTHEIGKILKELNRAEKITIILVTHNLELARMANKIIELKDGQINV